MTNTTVSSSTVVAYFSTESAAENAVSQLRDAGFTSNQIGVASRSSQSGLRSEYAGETGANAIYPAKSSNTLDEPVTSNTTVATSPSVASPTVKPAGTAHESAWDKVKNFFSSDPVEPYADERARGDFASHEITTGNDYSREDVRGSLTGLSVPEERSRYFGHRFGRGEQGAVVTVNAPGREAEAERILTENGGDLGNDYAGYDYSDDNANMAAGEQRIQLLGEVLRVHKDRVSRGEVRIRKEVITETQTVEVPVTREELVIERTAPTEVRSATGRVGEGSEIRIPLTEEVASIDKDTVVREEVAVGKRSVQSVANIGDNISHEELVVEDSTRNPDLERRSA
jgi:uncharacterized protein (TIGR02271 family)